MHGWGVAMRLRSALIVVFWLILCLLALSLVFTIIGSTTNNDGILAAGIIGWLVTSFVAFSWLVLWIWVRTQRYKDKH